MTKHFTNQAAQGDVFFERIDALPEGLKLAKIDKGNHVVAHSETGHHHVIDSRNARLFIDETNAFIAYLKVLEPCELKHLRDHDTHEALAFKPGVYRVRRQREATPEGWRRAQD
jgi:hypothetical protein